MNKRPSAQSRTKLPEPEGIEDLDTYSAQEEGLAGLKRKFRENNEHITNNPGPGGPPPGGPPPPGASGAMAGGKSPSYKSLQVLSKGLGIRANQSKEKLILALGYYF